MDHTTRHRVELLAPAGDAEALRAAVANGADAVYFGLANFNARHRASNLEGETLEQTLGYLHDHNVRGYVAFNTLVFSDELEKAVECIEEISSSGADSVIVQDLGILHLVGLMAPTLARHASTQMTLTDARGVAVVSEMGISRVILARELSIANIRAITAESATPVEVFCHGALCVAYSGQCLTSESIGGRSANRGMCAQACRLPYELMVDGRHFDQQGRQFLLSPQDLAAYDRVAELADAGVASLKIEGRLKSAQYVAATTSAYREAIDRAAAGVTLDISPESEAQLKQSFSRGFSHGFLDGVNHQALVLGTFSKKRGVRVGEVERSNATGVVIALQPGQSIKPGDGLVFDEGHPEQDEQGGRVYEVMPQRGKSVEVRFGRGAVVTAAVSAGAMVWKTDDPAINRQLEQTYSRDEVVHREKLACSVSAVVGEKLRVRFCGTSGEVSVESPAPLEAARKFPLDEATLREQLGRLGDTPFELDTLNLHGRTPGDPSEPVMAPKSVLNELRRAAVVQLLALRRKSVRHEVQCRNALTELREKIRGSFPVTPSDARLSVLVRTMEQLTALLELQQPVDRIWCEFEDVRRYGEAVQAAHAAGRAIGVATMRVTKPGEDGFLKFIADAQPDALLVRNLSALAYFAQRLPAAELVADYSLNVANEVSAYVLMNGIGWSAGGAKLARLTPSHDLNAAQLEAMLRRISPSLFEVVLHQHMPMFYMEHCVYAHMLSEGRDYRDCGRPCEKHAVAVRDRVGVDHPLQADAGCRNTVYNGRPQSIAAYVPKLRGLGVNWFRVELLKERGQEAQDLVAYYRDVLAGRGSAQRPRTPLKVLNLMGVTPGTMQWD